MEYGSHPADPLPLVLPPSIDLFAPRDVGAAEYRPPHGGYPTADPISERIMGYDVAAALAVKGRYP